MGLAHMSAFIAGASSSGVDEGRAQAVSETMSPVSPCASLAIMSAEQGANLGQPQIVVRIAERKSSDIRHPHDQHDDRNAKPYGEHADPPAPVQPAIVR